MSKFPGLAKWQAPVLTNEQHPTALDIVKRDNLSLKNKTVLVTGGSAGIGYQTVRALASAGARVFLLVRSVDKTRVLLDKISAEFPQHGGLEIVQGDFDSLASVSAAADEFLKRSPQLNILINNAGIYYVPFRLTEDGFESQLAVDHIAHHLLFKKLAPLLLKSSTPEFHSRVVAVASAAHLWADIDFNDMNYTKGREFTSGGAYSQAKLANILWANHIEKLYGNRGLHALSLHPGLVATEGFDAMTREAKAKFGMFSADGDWVFPIACKTSEQGAATQVWAAASPDLEGKGALYLEDIVISKPNQPGTTSGYSAAAFDADQAAKLWDWTEQAISKFA
jgi:NAD(P)-dependent dehydrogenase (short-subunit alcohol dehydrogenase family)